FHANKSIEVLATVGNAEDEVEVPPRRARPDRLADSAGVQSVEQLAHTGQQANALLRFRPVVVLFSLADVEHFLVGELLAEEIPDDFGVAAAECSSEVVA